MAKGPSSTAWWNPGALSSMKGAQGCLRVALRFEADDRRQAGGKAARLVTVISKGQLAGCKLETQKLRLASTVQMQNKMWFPLARLRQCLLAHECARDDEIRRERPL